ncbi:hypothetical protein ACFL3M_01940, partial [Patescibacteria group bacterium]
MARVFIDFQFNNLLLNRNEEPVARHATGVVRLLFEKHRYTLENKRLLTLRCTKKELESFLKDLEDYITDLFTEISSNLAERKIGYFINGLEKFKKFCWDQVPQKVEIKIKQSIVNHLSADALRRYCFDVTLEPSGDFTISSATHQKPCDFFRILKIAMTQLEALTLELENIDELKEISSLIDELNEII